MHQDMRQVQRHKVLTLHMDAAYSQRGSSGKTGIPLTAVNRNITVYQETGKEQQIEKANVVTKGALHHRMIA